VLSQIVEVTVTFRRVLSLLMQSQEHDDRYWGLNDDSTEGLKQNVSNCLHGSGSARSVIDSSNC
jgi:hypothetical protein